MAFGGSRDRGRRSAEDRARAAAERAARRAEPPPPDEVFQDALPPDGREPAYDPPRDEPVPIVWPSREPQPEASAPPERSVTAVQDRPPPPRRTPVSRRPSRRPPPRRRPPSTARAGGRRMIAVVALAAIGVGR